MSERGNHLTEKLRILGIDPFQPDLSPFCDELAGLEGAFPPGDTGDAMRGILEQAAIAFQECTGDALPGFYCAPGCPVPLDPYADRLLRRAAREGVPVVIHQAAPLSYRVSLASIRGEATERERERVLGPGDVATMFPHDAGTWIEGMWALQDPGPVLSELTHLSLANVYWVDLDGKAERVNRERLAGSFVPGHFRLLWIPPVSESDWREASGAGGRYFSSLMDVVYRLRAPGGCPWDRSHSHESLKPFLLEECHELLHAIDSQDQESLKDELGDVLLQVALHAVIADEKGSFDIAQVARAIRDKMVLRHPHVFEDVVAETPADVEANWERIKMNHRPEGEALLDRVPRSLPALLQAEKVQKVASRIGFDWDRVDDVVDKLREEVEEFVLALETDGEFGAELGDVLFSLVNVARFLELSPEVALLGTVEKFRRRLGAVQDAARAEGRSLDALTLEEMDSLWDQQKNQE